MAKSKNRRKSKARPLSKLDRDINELEKELRSRLDDIHGWEASMRNIDDSIMDALCFGGLYFLPSGHPGLKAVGVDHIPLTLDEDLLEQFGYGLYELSMYRNQAIAYGDEILKPITPVISNTLETVIPELRKREGRSKEERRAMYDDTVLALATPIMSIANLEGPTKIYLVVSDGLDELLKNKAFDSLSLPEMKETYKVKVEEMAKLPVEEYKTWFETYTNDYRKCSIDALVAYWDSMKTVFHPRFKNTWAKLVLEQLTPPEKIENPVEQESTEDWEGENNDNHS